VFAETYEISVYQKTLLV